MHQTTQTSSTKSTCSRSPSRATFQACGRMCRMRDHGECVNFHIIADVFSERRIAPRLVQMTVQACVPLFGSRGSQLQLSQLQGEHMAAFSFCGRSSRHTWARRGTKPTRAQTGVDEKGQPRKFWNRRVGSITNWTTAIYKVCHGFFFVVVGHGASSFRSAALLKRCAAGKKQACPALFHTTSCDQAVDDYFILQ